MIEEKMMDHLFRHQYGRMVSILTRIFGLDQLEIIEDAVQDTFVSALRTWRNQIPENPEAWLTKAAKNRAIDIFRKIKAEHNRALKLESGPATMALNDLFLDHEIEDSQLRMIFTACHPNINPEDQIAFALKTISGFSTKEIASALLVKEETVRKRLMRSRKLIQEQGLSFEIPNGKELPRRLDIVLEVVYLIFNEGFHSNRKDILIRHDLCGEAIRLCRLLLKQDYLRQDVVYALLALLCFHASRLDSKVNEQGDIIDLKNQDRTNWNAGLIALANTAMNRAVLNDNFSTYHYEAAIAAEHLKAKTFEVTNWEKILMWYEKLYEIQPSAFNLLNSAIVRLQLKDFDSVHEVLKGLNPNDLEQRAYLYYGTYSEYYKLTNQNIEAIKCIDKALALVINDAEKAYFEKKKQALVKRNLKNTNMKYFDKDYIKFFNELEKNNYKEWFHENKKRYESSIKTPFSNFIGDLILAIHEEDGSIQVEAKDCILRINRDIRFAKDKTPYNLHCTAFISPSGKKDKSIPGIFVRISPKIVGIMGGCFNVEKEQLKNIRTAISEDPKAFRKLIEADSFVAKFGTLKGEVMKRIPKDLQAAVESEPLIANKQFYFVTELDPKLMLEDNLIEILMEYWHAMKPVNEYLKQAMEG